MDVLRQMLAFPMYGAAVWLLWVVSQEAGASRRAGDGDRIRSAGIRRHGASGITQDSATTRRRIGWAGAGLAVALALAALAGIGAAPAAAGGERDSRGVHAGAARRIAGRGTAGFRQSDRRLVRHLPRQ